MNNLKTLFVAVFCAALTFTSFSQTDTDDTDCASARWILVKNSEKNAALFASLPEIFKELERQSDLKLLYSTRELQEVGPLDDENGKTIIRTNDDGTRTFVYQSKTITTIQSDVPLVDNNGDNIIRTLDDGTQSFIFEEPVITSLNNDVPLIDKHGDPIIETSNDGSLSFVYPEQVNFSIQPQAHAIDQNGDLFGFPQGDRVNYSITKLAISELKIVEARSYDAETGEYSDDFHVSRIAFCMNPSATQQERLWVDLIDFFKNMENPEESPFYTLLTEGNYKGFQYKQNPCK